jgi:hypothetical protein
MTVLVYVYVPMVYIHRIGLETASLYIIQNRIRNSEAVYNPESD